ncbi:hypothetical protein VTJ04DRAFT_8992 [Mycothermus thermophilus]|uniref:uncharacterized protein n=1 Tax=Humicola insolens TaxID=85995 RepID=UPI003743AAA8
MTGKNLTTWDHQAHVTLLCAFFAENPPSHQQWQRILARVSEKGYTYTISAAMYISPTPTSVLLIFIFSVCFHRASAIRPARSTTFALHCFISFTFPLVSSHHTTLGSSNMATRRKLGDRMTWDHDEDKALLIALLKVVPPSTAKMADIAKRMQELGYTCSGKAIAQHLQKLRRKDESGASTPAGRKRASRAKKEPGSAGTKRKTDALAEDDSEADVVDTPTKKVKKDPEIKQEREIKKEPKVKKEESDDDVYIKEEQEE